VKVVAVFYTVQYKHAKQDVVVSVSNFLGKLAKLDKAVINTTKSDFFLTPGVVNVFSYIA